jgi:hypothetical protein
MTPLQLVGLGVVVFTMSIAYYVAAARCVQANDAGRAISAGAWAAACSAIALASFYGALDVSAWLAIPEVLGAGIGTAIAVRRR